MKTILFRMFLIGGTAVAVGCVSPETTRSRGGGAGADVGNRTSRVELHGGADPFWRTPQRITGNHPPLEPARQARTFDGK